MPYKTGSWGTQAKSYGRTKKRLEYFKQYTRKRSKYGPRKEVAPGYNNLSKIQKVKYSDCKSRAKKTNREFNLSVKQFLSYWNTSCTYCGIRIETIGLDRIDTSKGYIIENIASCCYICNWMKRDLSYDEFIKHCKLIVAYSEYNKRKEMI